ncbi:MAG: hypothetical protein ABI999_09480 [Acidobacteriota bacterium]
MTKIIPYFLMTVLFASCGSLDSGKRLQNDELIAPTNGEQVRDIQTLKGSQLEIALSSEQLQVVNSILYAFKNDKEIPEGKKNLANYKLEIHEDKASNTDLLVGTLLVKREPNQVYVGGETENGIDVVYHISKKDFTVVQRGFPK